MTDSPHNIPDPRLAIHGGPAEIAQGAPSWPQPNEEIRQALLAAYADGTWGQYHGPHCERLSQQLAEIHGVNHALLCSSGTIAVEIALRGLGIDSGDEVILAGYDFSGNFRSIEAVGARPVLVDINPKTWSLDIDQVEQAIEASTRALIVSHLHGGVVEMSKLCQLAQKHNLAVVEDACQIPVGYVEGKIAGTWGDVGVLSFGGSKLLTAGRGGAIVTSREDIYQRAKIFCQRGNDAFPLSELQAAVLLPQLSNIDADNARRRQQAERLLEQCGTLPALQPVENNLVDSRPSYFKLAWLFDSARCGNITREQFIAAIQAEGVAIDAGFRGFTRRSSRRCRKLGSLEHSSHAAERTLLLHHPVLLEEDDTIDRVAAAINKVVSAFVTCGEQQ